MPHLPKQVKAFIAGITKDLNLGLVTFQRFAKLGLESFVIPAYLVRKIFLSFLNTVYYP